MKRHCFPVFWSPISVLLLLLGGATGVLAQVTAESSKGAPSLDETHTGRESGATTSLSVPAGALLRASLPPTTKISRLKPNTWLDAEITRPLYGGEREAVPAGSHVRILVESVRIGSPDVASRHGLRAAFARPFHLFRTHSVGEYYLALHTASIVPAAGNELPVKVSFLRLGKPVEIRARSKQSGATAGGKGQASMQPATNTVALPSTSGKKRGPTLMMQLDEALAVPLSAETSAFTSSQTNPKQGEVGLGARAYLLTAISASKNHEGDAFRARLAEPVRWGALLLPEGTIVEGRVARRAPPRWLSRPGMLHLEVERVRAPLQAPLPLLGSLKEASVDAGKGLSVDEEGTLRGRRPGVKAALIDLGVTYAIGKIADDSTEAILHIVAANMASTSVTVISRYVGLGSEVAFVVSRRGRDVKLPPYSEIQLEFSRPPGPIKR